MNLRQELLNPIALDIETAPEPGHPQEYALQPWRLLEGKARIDCISVALGSGEAQLETKDYTAMLTALEGKLVVTWNGLFDVTWLIAQGHWNLIKKIRWVDGMLLWKWASNSQRKERVPKWSLADAAKYWCADEPWVEAFVNMKKEEQHAGENDEYWETRAKLDAVITSTICAAIAPCLTDQQLKSAMIEMENIPVIARSWLIGVPYNYALAHEIEPAVTQEMEQLESKLSVRNPGTTWTPSRILRSPKQLGALLYETWGLEAKSFSEKTGAPSTDKAALTYLADADDRALDILRWRELNTHYTKYLQAPLKAREYLGKDVVHPAPRIFSTYTGRMTYSSKTARKFQTGIALHQWPRNKRLRGLVIPPKGFKHVEFDAAGQESRIMAEKSGDATMRRIFAENMDFHATTGAAVAGMSYEDFIKAKEAGNERVVGEHGLRYQGKFLNLSQNFRVGVKKMRIAARVQYGMDVDFMTVKQWQDTFQRLYPGIKHYWKDAISRGRELGYTETLGGRRFKLDFWSTEDRWSTESSALMFPIQGTGADMKELGLRELTRRFPEFIFWFDLHDGIHMLVAEGTTNERLIEGREMLNNIDYGSEWGYTPAVPLTWDVSVGANWATLKELK